MARTILLADDSVTAQNMGRRILSDAGYEVITVNNGSAALKKIAEIVPDLIVLDVYMPGYGGLEVCQRLKESQATARIPVLLTVGKLEPFKVDEAKRVRADAHIVKPFDSTELLAAIIKLEDRIVPQPAASKQGRSTKAVGSSETSRRGRDKSADPGGETTSGWKRRLGIPHSIPVAAERNEVEETQPQPAGTAFQDLSARRSQEQVEAKLPEAPATIAAPEETRPSGENAGAARPFENFTVERLIAMEASASEVEAPSSPPEGAAKPEGMNPEATTQVPSPEATSLETTPAIEPPSFEAQTSEPALPAIKDSVPAEHSPSEAEVMAALASLSPMSSDSGTDQQPPDNNQNAENSPPTAIGATLAAAGAVCGPRWIAEPVPLSDGESHLILESEMEKTYAAFAAAESAHGVAAAEIKYDSSAIENAPAVVSLQSHPAESLTESQLVPDVPAAELKSSFIADEPATSSNAATQTDSELPSPAALEPVAETAPEVVSVNSDTGWREVRSESAGTAAEEITSTAYREIAYAAAASAGSASGIETSRSEAPFAPEFPVSAPLPPAENSAPETMSAVSTDAPAQLSEPEHAFTEIAPLTPEISTPTSEKPERESELAAAWQNWRQIRESVAGPQLTSQIADVAAAGFKQIRGEGKSDAQETEAAASNRAAAEASTIAGIVDSVFAELKPKLMQEIARKLAEDRK